MTSDRLPKDYLDFLYFFQDIDLSDCNGNYQKLIFDRVTSYCNLLSKSWDALTLAEIKSIFDACACEFNFKEAA